MIMGKYVLTVQKNLVKIMKKKIIALFLAAAFVLTAACGSSGYASSSEAADEYVESKAVNTMAEEYDMDYDAAEAAMPMAAEESASGSRAYSGDVKLIYRADLSAETTDLGKATAQIEALAGNGVEIIYAGNTLSPHALQKMLRSLEGRDYAISGYS